ncbi:hypothetical protein [Sphingomonas sp.]|uniref:hypothetical protein n=1 Tax=Sphingomonas sp. TaxID=28214 RepID=UPI002EDA1A05
MRDRRFIAVLFVLVWFSCAWFGSWEWNPNTATRMYAAISLVEDGDATIDEFAELTIDKARFGSHTYLDKAPGMTLMALPAVALAAAVTGDRSSRYAKRFGDAELGRFLRLRTRGAAASGPALLTAIAAVLLYDLALGLGASRAAALFASLGYALGTPIWGWSTTLFGHAAVAALYVIAAWAGWRATGDRVRPGMAALAGAALGWAVVVEHQAVLAGTAIGLWILWRSWRCENRWRSFGALAAGGIAALLPLLAYNLIAFGTPFRLGYQGVVGWEGMDRGLFGLTSPDPDVLWAIVFGLRRGLIWVAPVLVLAPLGLAALVQDRRTRATGIIAAAVVAIVLLVNAAYVYWDGGNSTGPRLAMPMAGVMALGLARVWDMLGRYGRLAAGSLLALSIAINAVIAAAEIFSPPQFGFPIWTAVFELRFSPGDLRTVASEWLGWSAWAGFGLWAALALPALAWLARRTTRA